MMNDEWNSESAENGHAEVLRSIWLDRANRPDASEYLRMTAQLIHSAFSIHHLAFFSLTNRAASAKTSRIIFGVSLPVNVFCWLG